MTKPVTLFGRKMRKVKMRIPSSPAMKYRLGKAALYSGTGELWTAWYEDWDNTRHYRSPHAAARALERKIRAAHGRLGKMIAGTKGRSK